VEVGAAAVGLAKVGVEDFGHAELGQHEVSPVEGFYVEFGHSEVRDCLTCLASSIPCGDPFLSTP